MKKQISLISLLALAIAVTVGCGDSHSPATFTKLALLSKRVVAPATSLFTAKLDGTSVTPIPFATTTVWSLSSSADATKVAFVTYNGGYQLWVSNSDGSGQQQLTATGSIYSARISPSGKTIVYHNNSGHVSVINFDGTGNLDLTPTFPANMTYCYDPSFSADGSQIAFTCGGNSADGIYTVKVDGTNQKTVEVRSTNSYADHAYFSPDGKKVLFTGNLGTNNSAVISVNIDGSGETVVVPQADEIVILNSTLYYEYSCGGSPIQIFKAKLDGTSPILVGDSSNGDDLIYPGGGC